MSFPIASFRKESLGEFSTLENVIGTGNFCEVYVVDWASQMRKVAIKLIPKKQVERLRKENDVLMEKHALQRYV